MGSGTQRGRLQYRRCLRNGVVGLCLLAAVLLGACEATPPSPTKGKESPAVMAKRYRLWAWRVAQGHLSRKYPDKTLKFPNEQWDAYVDERENNYYIVTSYADSRDEQGKTIRIRFECVLRRQEREWKLVSLSILGQEEI